jgi:uncharacterized protein YdbL (DUF1318 family)
MNERLKRLKDEAAAVLSLGASLSLLASLAGCITVNVYFPEAEIEEAAEAIVDEVRPDIEEAAPAPAPAKTSSKKPEEEAAPADDGAFAPRRATGGAAPSGGRRTAWSELLDRGGHTALLAFGTGQDEKKIEIDIDDPVITKIKGSIKERYKKLLPLYQKGAVGERRDGLVEGREDAVELPLKDKRDLRSLVAAENKDRINLYERIAEANGVDKSRVKDIQRIFGETWIAKAKKGWWVQDKDGKWVQKAGDAEKKDEREEEKKKEDDKKRPPSTAARLPAA